MPTKDPQESIDAVNAYRIHQDTHWEQEASREAERHAKSAREKVAREKIELKDKQHDFGLSISRFEIYELF